MSCCLATRRWTKSYYALLFVRLGPFSSSPEIRTCRAGVLSSHSGGGGRGGGHVAILNSRCTLSTCPIFSSHGRPLRKILLLWIIPDSLSANPLFWLQAYILNLSPSSLEELHKSWLDWINIGRLWTLVNTEGSRHCVRCLHTFLLSQTLWVGNLPKGTDGPKQSWYFNPALYKFQVYSKPSTFYFLLIFVSVYVFMRGKISLQIISCIEALFPIRIGKLSLPLLNLSCVCSNVIPWLHQKCFLLKYKV